MTEDFKLYWSGQRNDFYAVCEALGLADYPEGQAPHYADISEVLREIKRLQRAAQQAKDIWDEGWCAAEEALGVQHEGERFNPYEDETQ